MALVVSVKVVPSSGRQKIVLEPSGQLKCFLKSPPENGKANRELTKLLAGICNVADSSVTIISGATVKKKMVKIMTDWPYDRFLQELGFDHQQPLL